MAKLLSIMVAVFAASASSSAAVMEGRVRAKNVFITGHIFSWGQCAAVATQISKDCYRAMPEKVAARAVRTANGTDSAVEQACVTHILRTPCMYGEMKYVAETFGNVDCSELVLLYEDAMEECLRDAPDARFWASIGYWTAIVLALSILSCCVGCIAKLGT